MVGVTDTTAARATAIIIYAKAGVKIVAMAYLTAGEARMANGAAVAAVGLLSLRTPISMRPKTQAEAEGRIMVMPMGGRTGEAIGIQMSKPFRLLGGRVPKYKRMLRLLNNCLNRPQSRKIHRHAVSAHRRVV